MEWNILEELYDVLSGLVIIMKNEFLKWDSQWLVLTHVLAILILLRYFFVFDNNFEMFLENLI